MKDTDTFGQYDPKTKAISLNRQLFDDTPLLKSEYEKLVQSGHFPKGTDYKSVIAHEFGHQYHIQNGFGAGNTIRAAYKNDTGNPYPSKKRCDVWLKTQLSEYAAKECQPARTEAIAETFSEWYNSSEPRSACKSIMQEILNGVNQSAI